MNVGPDPGQAPPGPAPSAAPSAAPAVGVGTFTVEALRDARPRPEDSLARAVGLGGVMGAVLGVRARQPTLDRYELRGVLGSGAMGTVYRAHDPHLDREVALKVLEGVEGQTGVDAVAEARNIARIDHPNVVTVFDAGTADGRLWVAMQLVEGGTLTARCRDPGLDLPDLLSWLIEAGEGLAAAHARGVVHRDVKPDNILIDARGVAKLADFGLASRESAAGSVLAGTPGFMAPEVRAGRDASPLSDQYSWCATAAWIAEQQGVELDPALRAAVDRGLRVEPETRWPSMSALLEAVRSGHARRGDPHLRATIVARVEAAWIDGVLIPSTRILEPVGIPFEWCPDLVAGPTRASTGPSPQGGAWPSRLDPGGKVLERALGAAQGSLLVSGDPGAGKTTAVLAWVKRRLALARRHEEVLVPVVFGLASFRGKGHVALVAWCIDQLVERYGLPRAAAQTWVEGGHAILVFDGLDEVPERHRDRTAVAVSELVAARDQPVVVVCRRRELEALAEPLALRGAVSLPPLDDGTLRALGVDDAELATIDGRSRAPLWAALGLIGDRTASGEAAALDGALDRWVGTALDRGASRVADRRGALAALAALMRRKGVSQLVLEDLQFDDIPVPALRRAMELSWRVMACSAVIGAVASAAVAGGRAPGAGISFALTGLLAILIVHRGRPVKMVERLTWSWRRALAWMPISVAFSTASGLLFGFIERTPGMSAAVGVQFGVMIALVVGLEPSRRPATVEANAGFRTSLRHAVAIGLGAAACFGLFFSTLAVPLLEPFFGPPGGEVLPVDLSTKLTYELTALAGVVSLGVYGGRAAGRHVAVRLGLAAAGRLPLRLVPWLEELVSRGLLRRVGGAYQFVHPTVLEHLAPASAPASETVAGLDTRP